MMGSPDPSSHFSIKKALISLRRLPSVNTQIRLPISLNLLHRLVDATDCSINQHYQRNMFKAMFLTAFYGFLRIGEMTTSPHCLARSNVSIEEDAMVIIFPHFKHSGGQIARIQIERVIDAPKYCPVNAVEVYLSQRGQNPGPLFMQEGRPISRHEFSVALNNALSFAGVSSKVIKSHSFRAGAASYWASKGASDAQIRLWGRWKSDAFKSYVRSLPNL